MNTHDIMSSEKKSVACLNCGTALMGQYCHVCGQNVRAAEPSLREFGLEFVEMMTHADSKVIRTIRRLFFDPAGLTRDYISGRRASEIPPIRMFFVSLLMFFALASVTPFHRIIADEMAEENQAVAAQSGHPGNVSISLKSQVEALTFSGSKTVQKWLHDHIVAAVDNPDEVQHVMGEWAERIVLLLLPISAVLLWILYALPKPEPFYNHLILSLHSLTVLFLIVTFATVLDRILPEAVMNWVERFLLLGMAWHLYAHLRGFYRRSVAGTIIRMGLLGLATGAACVLLVFLLTLIGLQFGAAGE